MNESVLFTFGKLVLVIRNGLLFMRIQKNTMKEIRENFIKSLFPKIAIALFIMIYSSNMALIVHAEPRVQNYGEELVIVIDPGHGGTNLGTTQNGFEEKTMTLVTAQAMYDELIQYDNVTVYMTRTDDRDMDLKERAEFAASVNADFLFSLHYNASANHTHFGSEIWISAFAPYNAYGYQFGYQYLSEMEEMGLFLRGIKTRIDDEGTDYYGVIRESVALSVPAAILEHCHVDEERDIPYCASEEEWIAFGKRDALAVAKYFGLSSQSLGVDYSQNSLELPKANESKLVQSTLPDVTDPDVCVLELVNTDYATGEVLLNVTAADFDSPLIYYDYSMDGGESFCAPIAWPGVDLLGENYTDTFTLSLQIPSGVQPEIILRAYNIADLYLESNTVSILQEFSNAEPDDTTGSDFSGEANNEDTSAENEPPESMESNTDSLIEKNRHTAGTITFTPTEKEDADSEENVSFLDFLIICIVIVVIIFFAALISQSVSQSRRRRRRRQRRKESEDTRNHPQ